MKDRANLIVFTNGKWQKKTSTLDDFKSHRQPVQWANLANTGLLVIYYVYRDTVVWGFYHARIAKFLE